MKGKSKNWLPVHWIARRFHLDKEKIYDLIRIGELQAVRFGPKSIRISEESLEQFLERHRIEPE